MTDVVHISLASLTAANNTAVSGISDAEGWLPSTVNNFTRAWLALNAGWYRDLGGQGTVGGTANAITLTNSSFPLTAHANGIRYMFKAGSANTGATTLNVDAVGAKAIRKMSGGTDVAITNGDIIAGCRYEVLYDATANTAAGAWILINSFDTGGISFTPGMTFNASATGVTFSVQIGYYAIIGQLVLFQIQITLTSNGSGVGTALVTGLPFTARAGVNGAVAVQPISGFSGLTAGVSANVTASATTISLRGPSTTGSATLTDTNVTDTASFYVAGHYYAA